LAASTPTPSETAFRTFARDFSFKISYTEALLARRDMFLPAYTETGELMSRTTTSPDDFYYYLFWDSKRQLLRHRVMRNWNLSEM